MKAQLILWALTIFMVLPIFSQNKFYKKALKLNYNPYLTKEYTPTDGYSLDSRVVNQAFYGLGREWFLNYHISLNTQLLYRFHDRTVVHANTGPQYLPPENRTIRTKNHLSELAFSARFYKQDHRSAIRVYGEAGIGNKILLKGSFSKPLHLDPRISSDVNVQYLRYGYPVILIGGGIQYRFSRRWGGEFQLLGRFPFLPQFGPSIEYGAQIGLIYFSKKTK